MTRNRVFLALVVLILGAAPAWAAYPISVVTLDGNPVVLLNGTGNVTSVDYVHVNSLGEWFVEVDTDNTNADEDGALLKGYQVNPYVSWAKENESLPSPAGARLDSFDSNQLNNVGQASFNFFLDGTSGTGDDSGVYFNKNLVIQESNISTAPQFSPNTPYIGFFETRINDNNQILIMASIDDPAIASTVDRAIVRVDNPGGIFTETVLVKEADEVVPGRRVTDFGTDPQNWSFNNAGSALYFADLDGASTTDDGTIWLNNTLLARESEPSPIAGRNWKTLSSPKVDLNNAGDFLFSATLDGDTTTDVVLMKNGTKVIQEGDTLADIAGWTFTGFGTGPALLDDLGNVLWYGDWNNPDTTRDKGLFLNDDLIVQEGVTQIEIAPGDFRTVDTIRGITEGFAFSDNGEWIIFRGVLDGNIDGAFLIHVPEPGTLALLVVGLVAVRRRG